MAEESQESRETREFQKEKIEVIYRKSTPIDKSTIPGRYPPLSPGVTVEDGIVCERDVEVRMRDGIRIYIDIYRPEDAVDIPAIIAWSPYGKRQGYLEMPAHGVPEGTTSPMAKFEGPDPAYWCRYGYAVINPDLRGSGNSEGDISFWTVRMKPGKPLAFGTLVSENGKRVPHLGLPGNPVSSMITFEIFARPAIFKMMGKKDFSRHQIMVIMEDSISNSDGRRVFARAVVTEREGRYFAKLTGSQGSGILTSMLKANALIIVPEDVSNVRSGDTLEAFMLD